MTTTKNREYREGWLGRKRTYLCRVCLNKFRVDTLNPLPIKERICYTCKYGHGYVFVDKLTGEETVIRGTGDVELATLRAWQINPNLTFKGLAK